MSESPEAFLARLEQAMTGGTRALSRADAAALDALALACARGAGAVELALGEGLDLLARTGGDLRLGFSGIGDLARERLGLSASQARRLRRVAVALRSRPLLRTAVIAGDVSARKAEAVLPVAVGPEEAAWTARARVDTLRRLEQAVGAEAGLDPSAREEQWHRIQLALGPDDAAIVEGALEAARILLGPTAPVWLQIWALAAEFLGTYPVDPLEVMAPRHGLPPLSMAAVRRLDAANASATTPSSRSLPPAVRPGRGGAGGAASKDAARDLDLDGDRDPYSVLARLTDLLASRTASDDLLGRACLLAKHFGLGRLMGWSSFDEWCSERLGLAVSTVNQRVALERRLRELPELRAALRARTLSYEQARLVARVATREDVSERIASAAGMPCIALVRALEGEAHRQMRDAGRLRAALPDEADALLADALRSARLHAGRRLTPAEALVAIARHFVATWWREVFALLAKADPVILRDDGLCQIPGCSRAADHVHHVVYRSRGGAQEPWNELSLCAPHHLLGVHQERVRITGRAPDGLEVVLGEREVAAARA